MSNFIPTRTFHYNSNAVRLEAYEESRPSKKPNLSLLRGACYFFVRILDFDNAKHIRKFQPFV